MRAFAVTVMLSAFAGLGAGPARGDEAPSCEVRGRYGAPLILGWTEWQRIDAPSLTECVEGAASLIGATVRVPLPDSGYSWSYARARVKRGQFRFQQSGRLVQGRVRQ